MFGKKDAENPKSPQSDATSLRTESSAGKMAAAFANRARMITKGKKKSALISKPLRFKLNPENISEGIGSKKLSFYFHTNLPPVWLPSYIIMDGVQVQSVEVR